MYAVDKGVGGVFFLYGYGGTGKTFIWRTLCSALRGRGDIVLRVASSGIASLLLPKGVGSSPYDADEIKKFADWILYIGDGVVGNEIEGEARFSLSDDILIRGADNPISAIVEKSTIM
ncbi:hypothetical protein OROMI_033570 [Orobanche minor]